MFRDDRPVKANQSGGRSISRLARAFLATSAVVSLSAPATAQTAESTQARQVFAIPSQSLDSALATFSRVAGVQILNKGAVTQGVISPGVNGSFTTAEALSRLLAGTGLTPRAVGADTVTVVGTSGAGAVGRATPGAISLEPVNVEGAGLPDAYTFRPEAGYVPTRMLAGTKTATPLIEVPQSVSVVPYDQIIAQNPQNTPQTLRYTSGIEAESRGNLVGGADIIYGRGFVLDRYLNGLQLQGGSGYITPQIDVFNLERVEVLRGPSSVLYGAASPGGLVDLVSKTPTTAPSYGGFIQGGTINNVAGGFDFSGPVGGSDSVFYRLTAVARSSDNQVDFTQQQRVSIAPTISFKPDSDTNVTLFLNYQDDPKVGLYNFVPAAGSVLPNVNGSIPRSFFAGDPNFNQYSRSQYSIGYSAERRLTDVFTVRQNFRYMYVDGTVRQALPALLLDDQSTLLRDAALDKEHVGTASVDTQLQSNFTTGPLQHRVLTGVDYQHTQFDQKLNVGFDVAPIDVFAPVYYTTIGALDPFSDTSQTQEQIGLYAQDQIRVDQWSFLIGGRQDWANSLTNDALATTSTGQYDQKFSWRAGLTYLFDNGIAPYGSYSTSFQPTAGVTADGSPFKPTTAEQYEVGVKYQPPGWNSFVTVSAYQITQQNVLTTDPNNILFLTQTGEIRSRGVEFSATLAPIKGLNVIASYAYNSPVITADNSGDIGNMPAFVPRNLASFWSDYTIQDGPLRGFQFGGGVRYVGYTFASSDNLLKVPSYTLFDAMLSYQLSEISPDLKGWRAAVNATNLFNTKYVSECSNDTNCLYGAGLRVLGTISKTF